MSVQALCQEAFQDLGVGDLSVEWVNGVWDSNFCDSSSLPEELETAVQSTEKWSAVLRACRQWSSRDTEEGEDGFDGGFWSTLLEVNVSHKSLMALNYCLMERCKQTAIARLCATYAAQLYLVLLQLPGSGAFKIFHPMIFQKALDVFYMWPEQESVEEHKGRKKKAKDVPHKSTSGARGGRRGKRGKRKRPNVAAEEEEDGVGALEGDAVGEEGEEEAEENSMSSMGSEVQMSEEENSEIKDSIRQLAMDLHKFLTQHSLRDHEATRYQVIQVLVRLTRVEQVAGVKDLISKSTLGPNCPLFLRAWSCLDLLFKPLHGGPERSATEVFHQLLPSLLLLTSAGNVCTAPTLPASLTTICQHALTFVCHIFAQHSEAVMGPLKTLLQHLCTKAPDKADYRSKLSSVVCSILSLFPDQRYSLLLEWIYKFSRNTKVGYRMFALDIVSELLTLPMREPTQGLPAEDEGRLSYKFLMKMILSRCSDKAPSVRSRALTCLSSAAGCSLSGVVETAKWCIHSYTSADPLAGSTSDRLIVSMLKRRAVDDKVGVRKAAIQALEAVIRLDLDKVDKGDVEAIHERCLDPALSARKQALMSLTALMLDRPDLEFMQRLWLDGVLPNVMDREAGGQEKCMSLLEQVILSSIVTQRRSTEVNNFVWNLLSVIAEEENLELRRYLRKALEYWSKEGKLSPALIEATCSEVNDPQHSKAAWILLSEMSQYTTSIQNKFILGAWKQSSTDIVSSPCDDTPFLQVVTMIGNVSRNLGKVAVGDIKEKIESLLLTARMSPAVIAAAINTLLQLCTVLKPQQYQASVDGWCEPLLKMCEDYLSSVVLCTPESDSQESTLDEKEMIRHLFILGEVAQLSPNNLSQHVCLMVQSLLLANSDEPNSSRGGTSLPVLKNINLSSVLRAHVYITLGKLCLQNEELTKKCVAQMSKELETSTCPAVKNNVIVVMCDLAIRYSARIDPYIPVISSCMKDPSLMVRKQALTLLTHLLQEDYVKWKGSLFFRFITTLLDNQMKKFAEFCLGHLLFTRHPTMFYQHFVECVFHFNNYENHRVYNRFHQTDREKALFCLKGSKNAAKRMEVYVFLLNHMTDEQRFQLTAKLCQEVIGGLVDKAITVEGDAVGLVKDTLAILASREIKLTSMRKNLVEELADDGDMVGAAVASAQTKIISQMVKRNVIENIVPTIVSAKHMFEREHSPLLKDLLTYLKELLNDYKNEVDDVLGSDPQLAAEIAFDLKKFEEEQRRATIQTPVPKTPLAQLASPLLTPGALSSPVDQAAAVERVPFTPPRLRHTARKDIPKSPLATAATSRARRPAAAPVPCTPTAVRNPAISRVGRALGISPLVAVAQTARAHQPSRLTQAHLPPPPAKEGASDPLTTPIAPRRLAAAINNDFGPHIMSPARVLSGDCNLSLLKTPQLNLQRMPIATGGDPKACGYRLPPHPPGEAPADETILPCGRVASTPEGLAEMISFNASTMVPPSPIPSTASVQSYMDTRRVTRPKDGASKRACPASADIMMLSPDVEPRRLDKWKVK